MGLVGPGQGPWIQTHVLKGLRVRVSGLVEGVVKVVFLRGEFVATTNGCYEGFEDEPMARVEYDGPDKSMVCTFLSGALSAIPQP